MLFKYYLSKTILLLLILAVVLLIFSYRLLDVPPGINQDEAAIGLNSILISRTLHDENNRLLPVFVLSNEGKDWHQPVSIYLTAVFFKIVTPSFYNLRLVSVILMLVSTMLIFYLLNELGGRRWAVLGGLFFITTPIMMIQSHLAMENIAPVPFIILWFIGLFKYQKSLRFKFLLLSAVALGISFYSYKGMRLTAPVWTILSLIFILLRQPKFENAVKPLLIFAAAILPFYAISPILDIKYAHAVFDNQAPKIDSYQQFFEGFLANLDLSFLYLRGDSTPFHSTGIHGSLLLASLPFFLTGAFLAIRQKNFLLLSLVSFLTAPLLFGMGGSIHRASRLLSMIPPYIIVCTAGAVYLQNLWVISKGKIKIAVFAMLIIMFGAVLANFADFIFYYWYSYPKSVEQYFPIKSNLSYIKFAEQAQKRRLAPIIEESVYKQDGLAANFFEQAYFNKSLTLWKSGSQVPTGSILMTSSEELPGTSKIDLVLPAYHLVISQ